MRAHRTLTAVSHHLTLVACEPESPWAAAALTEDVPPATLEEARSGRAALAHLLASEHAACADFLLALADFDRCRAWERLGHASLFAFLTRELGLSAGSAQLRLSAARLLRRHPAVEAALRDGRLCLSAVGQLARVLTPENEASALPRFFGRSTREAMEVVAELLPREAPPVRVVVTRVERTVVPALPQSAPLALELPQQVAVAPIRGALRTSEVDPPLPERPRTAAVEPLTADLRRLHLTVSRGFLEKIASARTGLSHAIPGATTEQVLEAALDLLLERQERAKALVARPRRARCEQGGAPVEAPRPHGVSASRPAPPGRRPHVPAAIEREVRLQDGGRCQFPLDGGGACGSTWQVELDHVLPLALGGATAPANLRCLCRTHHRLESDRVLGALALARRPKDR